MTDTPNNRISVTQAYNDESVIHQIWKLKINKQDKLTAGDGISISGTTISATLTHPDWGDIEGDLDDQTDLKEALDAKADADDIPTKISELTNDSGFITSSYHDSSKANASDVTALASRVSTNESNISSLSTNKQNKLTAGSGISIVNDVISNTQQSAVWGNISGTITSQTDLVSLINAARPLIWRSGQ